MYKMNTHDINDVNRNDDGCNAEICLYMCKELSGVVVSAKKGNWITFCCASVFA